MAYRYSGLSQEVARRMTVGVSVLSPKGPAARPSKLPRAGSVGNASRWRSRRFELDQSPGTRVRKYTTPLRGLSYHQTRVFSQYNGKAFPERPFPQQTPASSSPSASSVPTLPSSQSQNAPPATVSTSNIHENIYTLPNFLTVTRLVCAPLLGYCLIQSAYTSAFYIFIYAGLTDLIDGWMARRWNMQTVLGTILDPMADKALMTVVTIGLAVKGAVPIPLATLILGRDFLLGLSALYYRYISLPSPKTLRRYWDFSLPSAEVRPTTISKVNTFLQLGLLGGTMGLMAFGGGVGGGDDEDIDNGTSSLVPPPSAPAQAPAPASAPPATTSSPDQQAQSNPQIINTSADKKNQTPAHQILEASWWIVGLTTVWSGLSYVGWGRGRGGRGLRILSR